MFLLPQHPVIAPFIYAFLLYGVRFFILAGLAFFFTSPARRSPIGRLHIVAPTNFQFGIHIRRELLYSLVMLLVLSLVNAVFFGYAWLHSSLLYLRYRDYPAWWFWASIPAMVLLHDTLFYWMHRAMHTRLLYAAVHRLHHRSVYPTAFSAYSFSFAEALAEALIVTLILFIMPVHPLAFLIFQTFSTAYNIYGHCGREFFPKNAETHWLAKWFNTSSLHAHHHRHGRGNYAFYFSFWDRLMHTLETPENTSVVAPAAHADDKSAVPG